MPNAEMKVRRLLPAVALALLAHPSARADVVTDWNTVATEIVLAAGLPPPPAYRTVAIVQTAVYQAVNAITKRYPADRLELAAAPDASIDAAVAAANRTVLVALVPSQRMAIAAAAERALAGIPEGHGKAEGIALGERAGAAVVEMCSADGAATTERYRPVTTPGVYVPTTVPAVPQWPRRKPWVLTTPSQFRPGSPPDLSGERWARDYNEIKTVGAKSSATRTAEQTEIARFWEATAPAVYFPVARSVAVGQGREVTQNARLLAVVGQAMDDALVAVFDAKYHYMFWRPLTAIRNGDIDGTDATERDEGWLPLIDTPMHPEYPCAHCVLSGAAGAVLAAEIGNGTTPTLRTRSPTAPGIERSWNSVDDFVAEVAAARIYEGVHFRYSTEVGTAMGMKVGALAAAYALTLDSQPLGWTVAVK